MKYASKRDLVDDIEAQHQTLVELADSVPRSRYKEAGVWGNDWTVHDLFAHLTEWEQMFLRWFREGRDGGKPALPAPGFKWNETPRLNLEIQQKHRKKSTKAALQAFEASYEEILSVARGLTDADLFTPGKFAWTGKNGLISYLGANTASHYRTASKILKRWLRQQS